MRPHLLASTLRLDASPLAIAATFRMAQLGNGMPPVCLIDPMHAVQTSAFGGAGMLATGARRTGVA